MWTLKEFVMTLAVMLTLCKWGDTTAVTCDTSYLHDTDDWPRARKFYVAFTSQNIGPGHPLYQARRVAFNIEIGRKDRDNKYFLHMHGHRVDAQGNVQCRGKTRVCKSTSHGCQYRNRNTNAVEEEFFILAQTDKYMVAYTKPANYLAVYAEGSYTSGVTIANLPDYLKNVIRVRCQGQQLLNPDGYTAYTAGNFC